MVGVMVPILDGNSQHIVNAGKLGLEIRFVTVLDLIKCLKQIKKNTEIALAWEPIPTI